MIKQIVASVFLLVLLGFVFYNITTEDRNDQADGNEEREADDSTQEGAGMTAPNVPSGLQVGEQAPDFTLQTLQGETVQLSELKGKKVFINFWATWCPPCREEMPEMQKFYEEYGEEVEILAVNATGSEENISKVESYVVDGGYSFPILLDKQLKLNDTYQAISIPTTYFIGTDGVIQQPRKVGPMTYDYMVEIKESLH